jgi:hypothetical protein
MSDFHVFCVGDRVVPKRGEYFLKPGTIVKIIRNSRRSSTLTVEFNEGSKLTPPINVDIDAACVWLDKRFETKEDMSTSDVSVGEEAGDKDDDIDIENTESSIFQDEKVVVSNSVVKDSKDISGTVLKGCLI